MREVFHWEWHLCSWRTVTFILLIAGFDNLVAKGRNEMGNGVIPLSSIGMF